MQIKKMLCSQLKHVIVLFVFELVILVLNYITIEIRAKVILVLKKSDINKVIRLTQRERGTTLSKMSNEN